MNSRTFRSLLALFACATALLSTGCETTSSGKTSTASSTALAAPAPAKSLEFSSQDLFIGLLGEAVAASSSPVLNDEPEKPLASNLDQKAYLAWKQSDKS